MRDAEGTQPCAAETRVEVGGQVAHVVEPPPKLYELAAHAEQPAALSVPGLETVPWKPAAQTVQLATLGLSAETVETLEGQGVQDGKPVLLAHIHALSTASVRAYLADAPYAPTAQGNL